MNEFELHVCMDPSNPFMNEFDSKACMAMGFLYFSEYFNNDLGSFYVGYFSFLSRSLCFDAN